MSETSTDQPVKQKKSIFKRWWFWLIAVVIVIIVASSGNKSTDQTQTKTTAPTATPNQNSTQATAPKVPETIKISATKLYEDYKANEVAADTKYKGKMLEISGTVDDVKKDIVDTMYVTLKGDEYFGSVQCYFDNKYTSQLANLQKGQQLTITGKCNGLMMNVLVKNCEIVK